MAYNHPATGNGHRGMADNAAAAQVINAAAAAITSTYPPSPDQRSLKGCWSWAGLWCFSSERKAKRIVPSSRLDGGGGLGGSTTLAPGGGGWPTNVAIAPPSSPASFVNSSAQSPASFTLSSSSAVNMSSPGPLNPMFTIGPYAHETQLVSPPVFSTLTTEPSTAPLTPPPELAQLTTPSSPEVPFAQLLASSLEAKKATRGTISPFSVSSLDQSYLLYPGSPAGHLISPASLISSSGTSSPVPLVQPALSLINAPPLITSFPKFDPTASIAYEKVPMLVPNLEAESPKSDFCLDIGNVTYEKTDRNTEEPFHHVDKSEGGGIKRQKPSGEASSIEPSESLKGSLENTTSTDCEGGVTMMRNLSVRDSFMIRSEDASENSSHNESSPWGNNFDFELGRISRNRSCNYFYWENSAEDQTTEQAKERMPYHGMQSKGFE